MLELMSSMWLIFTYVGCPPIEYRMFYHVTRAYEGVVFESVEIVKELIEKHTQNQG